MGINLYPEMNERIAGMLSNCDEPMYQYAGAYIKSLQAERDQIGMAWDDSKRYAKRLELERNNLRTERDTLKADKNRLSSESIMHEETILKQSAEIDTLKKALELACEDCEETDHEFYCNILKHKSVCPYGDNECVKCVENYYIQQAQEQKTTCAVNGLPCSDCTPVCGSRREGKE